MRRTEIEHMPAVFRFDHPGRRGALAIHGTRPTQREDSTLFCPYVQVPADSQTGSPAILPRAVIEKIIDLARPVDNGFPRTIDVATVGSIPIFQHDPFIP